MKISTRARYGMRMMLELALNESRGFQLLKDIAMRQDVSAKYLSQIVMPLKAEGLIKAERGARGGYMLARPARDITLYDIVSVLEGEMCVVECVDDALACTRVPGCVLRDVWVEVRHAIVSRLTTITLADLVARCKEQKQEQVLYHI